MPVADPYIVALFLSKDFLSTPTYSNRSKVEKLLHIKRISVSKDTTAFVCMLCIIYENNGWIVCALYICKYIIFVYDFLIVAFQCVRVSYFRYR